MLVGLHCSSSWPSLIVIDLAELGDLMMLLWFTPYVGVVGEFSLARSLAFSKVWFAR
jgi:hypothetical protein